MATEVANTHGLAIFGLRKGCRDFSPDYKFTSSLRYMFSGDRSIVAVDTASLLEWAKTNW